MCTVRARIPSKFARFAGFRIMLLHAFCIKNALECAISRLLATPLFEDDYVVMPNAWKTLIKRANKPEDDTLQLVLSKCALVLLYGLEACPLNASDIRSIVRLRYKSIF